ncbi:hypothetical protein L2E82_31217 [Cichorium intybus]|uniref:Uncharacterized protein n=1 Tax=Cichorium intybus TaxID=13427 RepID=A0ACB9D2F4_CICIN|nr:hypothetical protein L2E82_31217 [Cichorium intybus]
MNDAIGPWVFTCNFETLARLGPKRILDHIKVLSGNLMVGKIRRDVMVLVVSVVVAVAVLTMEIPKTETVHADHMNVAAE